MDWAKGGAAVAAPTQVGEGLTIAHGINPDKKDDITVQGSEAWKKWRGKGLGSSDAAVLLDHSPWKNITQLYEEKLGIWVPVFGPHQRAAMARGTKLEPDIRRWYENRVGAPFTECIAEHPEFKYMRASTDGYNKDYKNPDGTTGRILEIKAPNAKDHELARLGMIPEKYCPQVQWLMLICAAHWADYVSYGSDGEYHVVTIEADREMQEELFVRAQRFWLCVETKTPPKLEEFDIWARKRPPMDLSTVTEAKGDQSQAQLELLAKNEVKAQATITDQELEGVVADCLKAQDDSKIASAKYEALKEKLKKHLGNNDNMEAGDGVFGFITKKGNVNYSVIPELIGIDLEQFRGAKVRQFFIKRKGEK